MTEDAVMCNAKKEFRTGSGEHVGASTRLGVSTLRASTR
jgi:hypothetical protein